MQFYKENELSIRFKVCQIISPTVWLSRVIAQIQNQNTLSVNIESIIVLWTTLTEKKFARSNDKKESFFFIVIMFQYHTGKKIIHPEYVQLSFNLVKLKSKHWFSISVYGSCIWLPMKAFWILWSSEEMNYVYFPHGKKILILLMK